MARRSALVFSLISLGFFVMFGCNDSSSNSSQPAQTEQSGLSGQIFDSMIQGLNYQTDSMQGLTDASGSFTFKDGETVTFSIGLLELGQAVAKPIMTIADLVDDSSGINNTTVLNIARLLQSIDADLNPKNGIQLTELIRDEVGAAPLDLSMLTQTFEKDSAVAALFDRLNALEAFGEGQTATLVSAESARAHFIQSVKDTWKIERVSVDQDSDGTEDGYVEYFRNEAGFVSRIDRFDGEVISVETFEYDDTGNMTRKTYDPEGDGIADRIEEYLYDDAGNKVRRWYDSDGDGSWNNIYSYEYDADNNLTRQSSDSDADGTFDSIISYTYNTAGDPLSREEDRNNDGILDSCWDYVYDASGFIMKQNYDDDADGSVDRAMYYTCDARGNVLEMSYDGNNDGDSIDINEWKQTFTYNASNKKTSYLTNSVNNGLRLTEIEYDANDNLSLRHSDDDYDGETPAWDTEETYLYDDNGNLLSYTSDNEYDGVIDTRLTITRDAHGNAQKSVWSSGGTTLTRTYDWQQSVTSGFGTYVIPDGTRLPN